MLDINFRGLLAVFISYVARDAALVSGTGLQAGRSRVRFPMASLEFFIDIILPAARWPWGSQSV